MDFYDAPKNIQDTILNTISLEKGISNNKDDPGGLTKDGITQATATKYGYSDVLSMTDDDIKNLYLQEYYLKYHFDLISSISDKIAGELFDTSVNIGAKHPILWLQNNLNLLNNKEKYYNDISVDAVIGTETVSALKALIAFRGLDAVEKVIYNQLNSLQGAYYYNLTLSSDQKNNKRFETFYWGWLRNRCDYIA